MSNRPLIWILAYCIALLAINRVAPAHSAPEVSVHLTHLYESYNDSFFDGHLPNGLRVYSGNADGDMAVTHQSDEPSEAWIEINPYYNNTPRTEALTLLHEMCHVYVAGKEFDAHGAKWQTCMHTLANQDAFDNIW